MGTLQGISRRDFVRVAGLGAAGLTFGGLLAACSAPQGGGTGSGTGSAAGNGAAGSGATSGSNPAQVVVAMGPSGEPPAGFDPFVSWGCGEHQHEPLIQSTLITTTASMDFENDLATSYSVSEDGLAWTFSIRDDVSFSDGAPLSATDVVFTINGIIASEGAEADLSMVDNAEARDATTVLVHLNRPFNALLYTLAVVGIVPAHAHGADYGERPIGSGRYVLEQWDKGQQVILAANPSYYGEKPQIERLIVVFMAEDAALAAARSGQVDLAATSATYSSQELAGYSLFAAKSVDSRGISLPTQAPSGTANGSGAEVEVGNAATAHVALRRALNYGIDRELLVQNVLNGHGSVAYSVGDGMPWSSADMQVATDVQKARGFLTDDGWAPGSDGIFEKSGQRAAFDLWYPASDSVRQALAAEFSNQMREVGIEVTVHGASWDELYPRAFKDPILWGWGSNAPVELYNLNHSKGNSNFAGYANATTDRYLDEALATTRIEDSYALWQKAQWDGSVGVAPQGEASWVWFANIDHLYFARDGLVIAQQKPHPHGHGWSIVNNIDRWRWE